MVSICTFIILLSLLSTFLVRKYAIRKAILDIPNDRSSHTVPTPRGGGIAIAIGVVVSLFLCRTYFEVDSGLLLAIATGLPLTVIGFLDDMFTLTARLRFAVQLLCAGIAVLLFSYYFELFDNVPLFLAFVVMAGTGIVWFINLFNFIDGIDGYLGSEGVIISLFFYVLTGNPLPLFVAASIAGFLILNWPKAKIFCGDVGSTLVGYIVAIFTLYFAFTGQIQLPSALIISSLFWMDASVTLLRRWHNGERLSQAHRKHAYQRIVQSGFSHQKTTLWSIAVNALLFAVALVVNGYSPVVAWLSLLGVIVFEMGIIATIDHKKPFAKS